MLLIAGYGYLGQEVARQALHMMDIYAITRSGGADSTACDLSDAQAVAALSSIIHPKHVLACASSGRGGTEDYRDVFLTGTKNLLENFPTVPLTFISSTSVYRQRDGASVTEESDTEGSTEKSRILLAAEQLVLAQGGTALRLAGIYGPTRSHLLQSLLQGTYNLEDTGDAIGKRILNQIHVADAASAILHLLTEDLHGLYNVCDDDNLSQLDFVRAACQHLKLPLPPSAPPNLGSKRGWTHKAVSNAKLRATGWQPDYPSALQTLDDIIPTLTTSKIL